MKTSDILRGTTRAAFVALLASASVGCMDGTDKLLGGGLPGNGSNPAVSADGSAEGPTDADVQASLACANKPTARAYLSFDGTHLEATRTDRNAGVDKLRQKPYSVLANEYQRVLGYIPAGLDTAGGSFNAPPDRWFSEMSHSAVSLSAMFDLSFKACLGLTQSTEAYAAPPTTETAKSTCTTWIRRAWSRSPSPEETDACVDLAVDKLAQEPDPRRRWAYACASVLSATPFLTF